MNNKTNKHLFAVYLHDLDIKVNLAQRGVVAFNDADLWQRVVRVLRLRQGEAIIAFNTRVHCVLTIQPATYDIRSSTVHAVVQEVWQNEPLRPMLSIYVGMTKKEAFEEAAYFAAQMGVNEFYPLYTEKVQRAWGEKKEVERLTKIMISAAEQAKSFILPAIKPPVTVAHAITHVGDIKERQAVFFEPEGMPLLSLLTSKPSTVQSHYSFFFGPEGGFTEQEKKMLTNAHVLCYALTPTILRTQEAVAVAVGALRSAGKTTF